MTNQELKEKYYTETNKRWYYNIVDYANWLEDKLIEIVDQPQNIGGCFTITTSPVAAEKIIKQCELDKRLGDTRSYHFDGIRTEKGLFSDFSVVKIAPKNEKIEPSDIFFLGFFSASQ